MRILLQSLFIILIFSMKTQAFTMKSGDILLQSNPCYLCALIEEEERTPYSHMGILVFNHGVWNVLEAWGSVHQTTLQEFLGRRRKETNTLVIRINHAGEALNPGQLLARFEKKFNGLSYDSQFLWNNFDNKGEKLYCSEFIAKFLQPFLSEPLLTKPMHFNVNRQSWMNYFHGTPPDALPGISPGDFERSPLFHKVGIL